MQETITISHHEAGTHGEYHAHVAGSTAIGRLTWVTRGANRVAEHTLVPEKIGGRGVAGRRVEALIADAQAQGFRIVPACSYVAAAVARHPKWAALKA